MTNYEVLYVLDSATEDEGKAAVAAMIEKVITEAGGEIAKVDEWGMRKLAYPIQKKNEGYYVLVDFQAGPELPKELDRRLKISDACIRHIIVNKDEK